MFYWGLAIFVVPRMTQPPLAINFFVNSITPAELLVAQSGAVQSFVILKKKKAYFFMVHYVRFLIRTLEYSEVKIFQALQRYEISNRGCFVLKRG